MKEYLWISDEVKNALANNKPVVALESTIISHGMPYPQNVQTALLVEKTIRDNGAVPATIAIYQGKICVGISKEQIEYLGRKGLDVIKASRRDLPVLLARKEDGATTVATTMIGAHLAGIKVFATGGIGGVHRGAETTMDISADLEELSTTDITVICAGAKSILDLGLTLEYLETKGVPVIGYQTSELPAFYCRHSGYNVDYKVDSPKDIALSLKVKDTLNLRGGMLIANPIPQQYAMNEEEMDKVISAAIKEATSKGIKGKNLTPFLLSTIKNSTNGDSLEANIELVLNNARLGAQIAIEYSKLKNDLL